MIRVGGAFSSMSREDVELFCIDKQVLVEVTATEEALIFDFESTTSVPHEHSVRITFCFVVRLLRRLINVLANLSDVAYHYFYSFYHCLNQIHL